MTLVEAITSMIASVCAIIGALIFTARYLARRFDRWIDATLENSAVMRSLSARVTSLERVMKKND